MGGKGGDRARIVGFELGECVQVALGRWTVVLLGPQRLEGAQRLGFAAQHQIADRAAL